MAFPDAWMNELLSKNDIVSVVSHYVELRPKGRRLWGLCPIHGEKTPSFSVSPDKQLFYCFGCHAGGSVIQFVMEMERLSYGEAVRYLAERSGMEMPEQIDDTNARRERAYRERLYAALKLAARFYMETLIGESGAPGRTYLTGRSLSSDAVKRFGIGYAPDSWDALLQHLTAEGFSRQELLDAGLLVHNESRDTVYDAFRNRIMFPIIGTNGRVLGFGARVLNNDEKPKYINTGDTLLYNKRFNLYGLNLQKGEKAGELIIVEGYTDVIGLYEAGVRNAVASLGTALTKQQARLIKRYAERVYIAYDGDAAGQNATLRGLDILTAEGLDVRVIVFPDDKDPDEFVRSEGKHAFDALRDAALTLNAFKLAAMARRYALENENEREKYAMEACAFISGLQPVERDRYYEQLARRTGYPLSALKEQGARGVNTPGSLPERPRPARTAARRSAEPDTERQHAESALLRAMLQSHAAALKAVELGAADLFTQAGCQTAAMLAIAAYAEEREPNCAAIAAQLSAEDADRFAAVLRDDSPLSDPVRTAKDCVARINRCIALDELAALRAHVNDASLTAEERNEVLQQIGMLTRRLKG